MRLSNIKLLLSLGVMLSACGGGSSRDDVKESPIRTGGQLESIPIKYYDVAPSLSADGLKVVFLSGRDTSDEGAQMRAYRADWPADTKPGKPVRVTSEDKGFEKEVSISPDGTTIALLIASGNKHDIYTIPYAGGDLVALTTNGGEKKRLRFSPDGALLTWIHNDGAVATAVVGNVATNTAQAVKAAAVSDVFWVPTTEVGGYKLGVRVGAETAGQAVLQTATFTNLEEAASASFSALGEAFISSEQEVDASADWVVASKRVLPAGALRMERLGDYVDEKPENIFKSDVEDIPALWSTSDGSVTDLVPPIGDGAKSFNLTNDGLHFLSRNSFRCVDDQYIRFAWALASTAISDKALIRRFPRMNQEGAWEVAEGVCAQGDDAGKAGQIDEMVTELRVATNGTLAAFRGAYVSRFSSLKDRDCRLKAGDPEVRLIEVGATDVIYELSQNPYADLEDTSRGDSGPCP